MEFSEIINAEWFKWGLLPVLIFLSRVVDVSMATLRAIFVNRGLRFWAPILGFFEVMIWLLAVRQIFQNLDSWVNYVAYAGGFSTGTFVGMYLEGKLAVGTMLLRVIVPHDQLNGVVKMLSENNYGITFMEGHGAKGKVGILMTIVKRKKIAEVINLVKEISPTAFYTTEDVRFMSGKFYGQDGGSSGPVFPFLSSIRK